ncbi:hypothetical protein B0H19DRAFT_1272915 [Mycena capillaripes]|nr:hypothetical protein B0H19DRAFT_1272915 [Mycena capillaripes]
MAHNEPVFLPKYTPHLFPGAKAKGTKAVKNHAQTRKALMRKALEEELDGLEKQIRETNRVMVFYMIPTYLVLTTTVIAIIWRDYYRR